VDLNGKDGGGRAGSGKRGLLRAVVLASPRSPLKQQCDVLVYVCPTPAHRYSRLIFVVMVVLLITPWFVWASLIPDNGVSQQLVSAFAVPVAAAAVARANDASGSTGTNCSNSSSSRSSSGSSPELRAQVADVAAFITPYGASVLAVWLDDDEVFSDAALLQDSAATQCHRYHVETAEMRVVTDADAAVLLLANGTALTAATTAVDDGGKNNATNRSSTTVVRMTVAWSSQPRARWQAVAHVCEHLAILMLFFAAQCALHDVSRRGRRCPCRCQIAAAAVAVVAVASHSSSQLPSQESLWRGVSRRHLPVLLSALAAALQTCEGSSAAPRRRGPALHAQHNHTHINPRSPLRCVVVARFFEQPHSS
jgi:hypothetical protein